MKNKIEIQKTRGNKEPKNKMQVRLNPHFDLWYKENLWSTRRARGTRAGRNRWEQELWSPKSTFGIKTHWAGATIKQTVFHREAFAARATAQTAILMGSTYFQRRLNRMEAGRVLFTYIDFITVWDLGFRKPILKKPILFFRAKKTHTFLKNPYFFENTYLLPENTISAPKTTIFRALRALSKF